MRRRRDDSDNGDGCAWHRNMANEKKRRKRIAWWSFEKFCVDESVHCSGVEARAADDGIFVEGVLCIVPDDGTELGLRRLITQRKHHSMQVVDLYSILRTYFEQEVPSPKTDRDTTPVRDKKG